MKKIYFFRFLLLILLISFTKGFSQESNTGISTDGRFRITKSSDVSSVPAAGGQVTYTYTLTNISGINQYYVSGTDDECSPLNYNSGMFSYYDVFAGRTIFYLPIGGSATWTCTEYISQTTTNNATFTFADSYTTYFGLFDWQGESTATASVTVVRNLPTTGITDCNTIWFGTDQQFGDEGTVGMLQPDGSGTISFNIGAVINNDVDEGTSALAVDVSNPDDIYFIPRAADPNRSNYGGLWVYKQSTGIATKLSEPAATPDVVRLATSPDGKVWTISDNGELWYWTPDNGSWTLKDNLVALSDLSSWSTKTSGDIVFDGNGNMYIIASSFGLGKLYIITEDELAGPDGSVDAQYVGDMGAGIFNGIAFGSDGVLYASARDASNPDISYLYTVDILTGQATVISTIADQFNVSDLASCALPQPDISFIKTSSIEGEVTEGETITYTLKACNTGTLTATQTYLEDAIPTGTTYVLGSTKLNGTPVADINGEMPYTTKKLVNSPTAGEGRIGVDQCATITFDVVVNVDNPNDQVCNKATLTYTGGEINSDDPNQPGGADATCNRVKPAAPTLDISKTSSPSTIVNVGDIITYDITIENTGTVDAKNVIVNDLLPDGLTYIDNSATKTYWDYSGATDILTGSYTHNFPVNVCFGASLTQSVTITSAMVPANAELTSISYRFDVETPDYLSDLSLIGSYPGGNLFSLPKGTFGGDSGGTGSVSNTISASGSALGDYTFVWDDSFNGTNSTCGLDNILRVSQITLNYTYTQESTDRIQVTNFANSPENMVTFEDEILLLPGESMTVQLQARVDAVNTSEVTNTAQVSAGGLDNFIEDTAVNSTNTFTAINDTNQTILNTPVSGNILWNDIDREGDTFSVTEINGVAVTATTTITVSGTDENGNSVANAGTITINPDGTYDFIPTNGFTGTIKVNYSAIDANGAIDTAILVIDVTSENTLGDYSPIAKDDNSFMEPGSAITIPILDNDSDVDGNITPDNVTLDPGSVPGGIGSDLDGDGDIDEVVVPGEGTWSYNPTTGDLTFTPESGFVDSPSPIDYTVKDQDGLTDSATVTLISETPGINEMGATDDGTIIYAGSSSTGNILNNDTDPDGSAGTPSVTDALVDTDGDGLYDDVLTIGTSTPIYGTDQNGNTVISGSITLNSDGTYTYISDANFVGNTAIQYTVCDNDTDNACANATLELTTVKAICTVPGASGTPNPTYVGISTLERNVEQWLPENLGAYLVLESTNKGFIITRNADPATNITNAVEGMVVWDTTLECLRLYDGTQWECVTQGCNQ